MVELSVLDLAYIGEGFTPADALANALDLAQRAEAAGFARFWLAEHHNLGGIASAATAVCICHVAGGTKTIRVGAGGIMLPNHSPMVIAEQFGTLAELFPDRIDLGLGRAPGTDQRTLQALRRGPEASEYFPQDVVELQALLGPAQENQTIHAIPGEDTNVPLWILGSSLYGAQLAAMLGLPYAFASHFAPQAECPFGMTIRIRGIRHSRHSPFAIFAPNGGLTVGLLPMPQCACCVPGGGVLEEPFAQPSGVPGAHYV